MNINLIRIISKLHQKSSLSKENDSFIEEINNLLIDEDILIKENANDSKIDLVFVESGGSEQEFVKLFPNLKEIVILLTNCKNNSLPASLEIKTYCLKQKKTVFLLFGDEKQIADALQQISIVVNAYYGIMHLNMGIIGEPSDWLIASQISDQDLKEVFEINPFHISSEELINEINKKEFVDYLPHYDEVKNKYLNEEIVDGAYYIYSALKRLIKKYNLNFLTVRCFDLLEPIKNTSCLALALLNEEGIISACEGDVPSLITMELIYLLTERASFQANPSQINFEDSTILLAHCSVPLNMVSSYSLDSHFESDIGIGIKGNLPLSPVTVCKVCPDLKFDNDVCFKGDIVENASLKGYCRTQIKVKVEEDGLINILEKDYGNHVIITYSDIYSQFVPLLGLFKQKKKKSSDLK